MDDKIEKIKFQNIGSKKQHEPELIDIAKRSVDITKLLSGELSEVQSSVEELLTHITLQVREFLKYKGFEDTSGYFKVINGNIERWNEKTDPRNKGKYLFDAIEERDKARGGQTGEFLAAFIDYWCRRLEWEWANQWWEKPSAATYFVLNTSMYVQELFFKLVTLEKFHMQYSTGKVRLLEANMERNLRVIYEQEAEDLYRKYREEERKKENIYNLIEKELKRRHPEPKTPKAGTIKGWFKSRKDLP